MPRARLPRGLRKVNRPLKDGTPRTFYEVRVNWEDKRHYLGRFESLEDATTTLTIARGQMAAGTFIPPALLKEQRRTAARAATEAGYSYREWTVDWMQRLRRAGRKESTIISYRSILDAHILDEFGDTPLRAITPELIESFLDRIAELPAARYKNAKTNGILPGVSRCLRASLNAAVEAKRLDVSPFRTPIIEGTRVRPGNARDDVATTKQVTQLEAHMPDYLKLTIPLAAWCQLRLGEVLGLTRASFTDLDKPDEAMVHVFQQINFKLSPPSPEPPKTDAGERSLSIPAEIVPQIVNHLEHYAAPGPGGYVFTRPNAPGKYVAESVFDRHWRSARDKVGMPPGFRFHDLRHTGLTAYAQLGATQAELMHRGGHADVKSVQRYQHATIVRDRSLTRALSKVIAALEEDR